MQHIILNKKWQFERDEYEKEGVSYSWTFTILLVFMDIS